VEVFAVNTRKHRSLDTLIALGASLLVTTCACSARPAPGPSTCLRPEASPAGQVTDEKDVARLKELADARAQAKSEAGYRIGPDDLVEIRIPDLTDGSPGRDQIAANQGFGIIPAVAQAPVFRDGLRVDAFGNVSLPLIGSVKAEGLTPAELEVAIADRLRENGILRAPQVSAQVIEYRSRVVAVVGSVERPGLYPLTRPGATVSDMVWAAGGPTKDSGRVVEFAAAGQQPAHAEPIRIDMVAMLQATGSGDRALDPPVRPGDVITLSPAGSVLVDGWVARPGSYPVTRGLTLSGAIAAAGGDVFAGDRRRTTVSRIDGPYAHQPQTVNLDDIAGGRAADIPMTDGDVVHVPMSPTRIVPYGMWTLVRDLVRIGGTVLTF
jgi:polysaccharide biosynthesis/export protein